MPTRIKYSFLGESRTPHFFFTVSRSIGLLSASVRYLSLIHICLGNMYFHISRNKQIIRTRPPQGKTGSDYIGLVRVTGLEPVRQRHTHLKRACLPVPAFSHMKRPITTRRRHYYSTGKAPCQQLFVTFSGVFPVSVLSLIHI